MQEGVKFWRNSVGFELIVCIAAKKASLRDFAGSRPRERNRILESLVTKFQIEKVLGL